MFLKHFYETITLPTFTLFLSEHAYVVWLSRGSSNLLSIFRHCTLRYQPVCRRCALRLLLCLRMNKIRHNYFQKGIWYICLFIYREHLTSSDKCFPTHFTTNTQLNSNIILPILAWCRNNRTMNNFNKLLYSYTSQVIGYPPAKYKLCTSVWLPFSR